MNIKNEKGFVVTDITVALIIILIFISITSVLFFNITKASKSIERESQATYIATDIIEAVKLIPYSDLKITEETSVTATVVSSTNKWNYSVNGSGSTVNLNRNINLESGYTCKIEVSNFVPSAYIGDTEKDYIKQVTVKVIYKLANEEKNVTLKTAILREI